MIFRCVESFFLIKDSGCTDSKIILLSSFLHCVFFNFLSTFSSLDVHILGLPVHGILLNFFLVSLHFKKQKYWAWNEVVKTWFSWSGKQTHPNYYKRCHLATRATMITDNNDIWWDLYDEAELLSVSGSEIQTKFWKTLSAYNSCLQLLQCLQLKNGTGESNEAILSFILIGLKMAPKFKLFTHLSLKMV